MLPDLDVITFYLGIPYGSRWGHRGFSHSFFFALVVSLPVALLTYRVFGMRWWVLWALFFAVTASHGVLDAFTNGGHGIAFFAPFDATRYFFPWRPVQVSLIGMGFFTARGLAALVSEIGWIWLPTCVVVGLVWLARRSFRS